jgi:glycosyltransferase involved in cell wall biosynthesis
LVITSDREGMASVMLEAMSRGVPVVSTDVSGAREALEPGPDGQPPGLVTGFAPPEIASAMNSIVYDRNVRNAMGRAANERYRERFSFERILDGWEAVLAGD